MYIIYCMDSICNDPKRVLGSYIKGPNNKICRAWVWQARPWSPGSGSGGSGHRTSSKEFMELRALIILLFLGLHCLGNRLSPPPFLYCFSFFFILAFTLSPVSTCKFNFSGVKTCPISPYLEWLGVVVKAEEYGEEHGPVRYRVLYCRIGSLLLGPLLYCAHSFF